MNGLRSTLIVSAEENLEVRPRGSVHAVSKVDIIIESLYFISWDSNAVCNQSLESFHFGFGDANEILNSNNAIVMLETEAGVALDNFSLGRGREDFLGKIIGLLNSI